MDNGNDRVAQALGYGKKVIVEEVKTVVVETPVVETPTVEVEAVVEKKKNGK